MRKPLAVTGELHEISHLLGEIEGGLASLTSQFQESERVARDSRSSMHNRMDTQDRNLATLASDTRATQSSLKELHDTIENDIRPVTDDIKRMRMMGIGALGVIGFGGMAVGSFALWALQHTFPGVHLP